MPVPRLIDSLPPPKHIREKKLIVLSRSRVGTFSLYQSLKILGYKPYHMYEVLSGGVTQVNLFEEALRCKYLNDSGQYGKPYGKAEFDKWLGNYDAIVEIPQFFLREFIAFYPSAQFILTERDVDSWMLSLDNTIKPLFKGFQSFPLNVISQLDAFLDRFRRLQITIEEIMFHGRGMESVEGRKGAKRDFLDGNKLVKSLVPKPRLLVCKLENGFGWEQICPFLGHAIPATPYPRGNAPAEFEALTKMFVSPGMRKAGILLTTSIVVPVMAGVGGWWWYGSAW